MALTIAWLALAIAVVSAAFTGWQAFAASGVHKIERRRDLAERRPRFSGEIAQIGPSGQRGVRSAALKITLETDEPLAAVEIKIARPYQGVAFQLGYGYGVMPIRAGEVALSAFVYDDSNGVPSGMQPRDSQTWAIEVQAEHAEVLRIEATCHGQAGERWDSVLITAKMPPPEPNVFI